MKSKHPILIVGQGIAGTLLSFELYRNEIPFLLMDKEDKSCASWISGAVLNPYSGRTIKGINRRSQMYQIAYASYKSMEDLLNLSVLQASPLMVFGTDEANYELEKDFRELFNHQDKVEFFEEVALVKNEILLKAWRAFLKEKELLIDAVFEENELELIDEKVHYRGTIYERIIFCTGVKAMESKYFAHLRFTANRGDVLLLNIPKLSQNYIYQKDKLRLLPRGAGKFWCGSNYIWQYEDMIPNIAYKDEAIAQLKTWLKIPFELIEHTLAKRPTTAGQIPFIGWHPQKRQIGICNGLGTKGFSAGPMWVKDFVEQTIIKNESSLYQSTLEKYL